MLERERRGEGTRRLKQAEPDFGEGELGVKAVGGCGLLR